MMSQGGQGLAATQVGWDERILVVNVTGNPDECYALINPEIIEKSRKTDTKEEGCLSFPMVFEKIKRPTTVTIRATGANGEIIESEQTGWMARCIQHEMDHLNGVLFIDKMTSARKLKHRKKFAAFRNYYKAVKEIEAAQVEAAKATEAAKAAAVEG